MANLSPNRKAGERRTFSYFFSFKTFFSTISLLRDLSVDTRNCENALETRNTRCQRLQKRGLKKFSICIPKGHYYSSGKRPVLLTFFSSMYCTNEAEIILSERQLASFLRDTCISSCLSSLISCFKHLNALLNTGRAKVKTQPCSRPRKQPQQCLFCVDKKSSFSSIQTCVLLATFMSIILGTVATQTPRNRSLILINSYMIGLWKLRMNEGASKSPGAAELTVRVA